MAATIRCLWLGFSMRKTRAQRLHQPRRMRRNGAGFAQCQAASKEEQLQALPGAMPTCVFAPTMCQQSTGNPQNFEGLTSAYARERIIAHNQGQKASTQDGLTFREIQKATSLSKDPLHPDCLFELNASKDALH